MDKKQRYAALLQETEDLIRDIEDPLANCANVASLLYHSLPDINWAGFYFLRGDRLVLGPFHGKPACVYIPVGKGVCGTAAERNETVVVADVHAFPGHIACDAQSRSEIVVPLRHKGAVVAVLDIDSPGIGRFDDTDASCLERLASILSEHGLIPL